MTDAWIQHFNESQAGESPVLRALLPDDPVVYVDVGTGDYLDWNVTWPFYEAGGHGLLVEPRTEMVAEYLAHRPRDMVCCAGVSDKRGWRSFRLAGSASSLREDWQISHIETGSQLIHCEPLRDILARYPDIRDGCQLCSIDVEGWERHALLGIDWDRFRPDVMIIEYIFYDPHAVGPDISGDWASIVTARDRYRECCRSHLNIIYLRSDLWGRWEAVRDNVPMPHQTLEETRKHIQERYCT